MSAIYTEKIDNLVKDFNSNIQTGLTDEQVLINRQKYGTNELTSKKQKSWFMIFLDQYKDILMILLLISGIISLIVEIFPTKKYGWGESLLHIEAWENFILIVGITILNAIAGTVQIIKSRKSLDSLKTLSQPKTKVLRNGINQIVDTNALVVGDIIILEAGDLISADARLIEASSLKINEASLTGESEAIIKNTNILTDDNLSIGDRLNMIYSGCLVLYGRAKAIVTAVGAKTEIGKINTLLNETVEQKTPLQNNLDKLARVLMWVVLVVCSILLIVNLSKLAFVHPLDAQHALPVFSDSLNFSIALAVAAIPEALSSIVIIVLSISTKKMAKQNAIVKDMKSVEGLGSVSVVCSDKTGTLTQNKMTITNFFVNNDAFEAEQYRANDNNHLALIKYATLCCDAKVNKDKAIGDPTEIALVDYWIKQGSSQSGLDKQYPRISDIPFDSERMMMSVLVKDNKSNLMITKGAIDNLLNRTTKINLDGKIKTLTSTEKNKILAANKEFSDNGKRVLCICYKEIKNNKINFNDENDLIFLGLMVMIDPPRPEVIEAIKECNISGIKVVMITGDHVATATAIGKQIGIYKDGDWALSGKELTKMSQDELACNVAKYSVYARVSPEDKIKIVRAWQSQNMIVSMTGDGVNDAPALKQADIGVAMGITGTEVSKDAASMILTDDNFATIVSAIKSGRNVYNNIKSAIKFLLTGNLSGIIVSIILTIISLAMKILVTPFTAIQLLFLNLLTDSWPAISLGLEKYRNNVIYEKPRLANEFFLNKQFSLRIFFESLIMSIIVLIAFAVAFVNTHPSNLANNIDVLTFKFQNASGIAFITLCFCRFFHGFNCKSEKPMLFKKEFYDNWYLFGSILLGIVLLSIVYYIPQVYDVMFKSNDISEITIPRSDIVFCNYGIWVGFGFGFLIIPTIQLYKWAYCCLRYQTTDLSKIIVK